MLSFTGWKTAEWGHALRLTFPLFLCRSTTKSVLGSPKIPSPKDIFKFSPRQFLGHGLKADSFCFFPQKYHSNYHSNGGKTVPL